MSAWSVDAVQLVLAGQVVGLACGWYAIIHNIGGGLDRQRSNKDITKTTIRGWLESIMNVVRCGKLNRMLR